MHPHRDGTLLSIKHDALYTFHPIRRLFQTYRPNRYPRIVGQRQKPKGNVRGSQENIENERDSRRASKEGKIIGRRNLDEEPTSDIEDCTYQRH